MKWMLVFLFSAGVVMIGCSKGNNMVTSVDCSGAAKSFVTDVNPIIQANCTSSGCHNSGSNNGPGALTSYQLISNARASIRTAIANGSMPQGGSLSAAQRNAIICWIDNGATNN